MTFTLITEEPVALPTGPDPTADLVADALREHQYDDVSYSCDPPALVSGMVDVELRDLLDAEIDADELADAIRERAIYVSNADRLRRLKAQAGALTDELEVLKAQEISTLSFVVTAFEEDSRWSPHNLLLGTDESEHSEEYFARPNHHYSVVLHQGALNSYRIVQHLSVPLGPLSKETVRNYRYEIEHYFATLWTAQVEVIVGPQLLTATRETLVDGTATKASVDRELGGDGAALDMFGQAGKSVDADALLAYLADHEHIDTMVFLETRQAWIEGDDPVARMQVIGTTRMSIEEWAIALGIVSTGARLNPVDGELKEPIKLLRAFTLNGRIDGRAQLADALDRLVEACEDPGSEFALIAAPLASRLRHGPMTARPAPCVDR